MDKLNAQTIMNKLLAISGFDPEMLKTIDYMKSCYELSKSENQKLSDKLRDAYNPYFGIALNYEFGLGTVVSGDVFAELGLIFGIDLHNMTKVSDIIDAIKSRNFSIIKNAVQGINSAKA